MSNLGKRYPPQVMTPDEIDALIDGCSATATTGIRNRALLTLLYRSGLRISEALAIKPSDVRLAAHNIRVLDTKSGEPQTRGFHPNATDTLARWMDTRRGLGLRNGPLFCTLDGRPMYAQYVRQLLGRLATQAGIDKRVHPHGLRHTYAAELEYAGTPVSVISKLLGHSSVGVTSRYLDHLTNQQAVTVLESVNLPLLRNERQGA